MDDAIKFTDKLIVAAEGGQYSVTLIAIGIGSTLICDALANGFIHFGTQLTYSVATQSFEINNRGRFIQQISWESAPHTKKHTKSENIKPVFSFAPMNVAIPPQTSSNFTVTGIFQEPGFVTEGFLCTVVGILKQKEQVFKMLVDVNVVAVKLLFSKHEVKFVQLNDGSPHTKFTTNCLTCQNVYPLPLAVKMTCKPPFGIEKVDFKLVPNESITICLTFEWQDPEEKKSTVITDKLNVEYDNSVQKDTIDLIGEIHFPNLRLSTNRINFEYVFHNPPVFCNFSLCH